MPDQSSSVSKDFARQLREALRAARTGPVDPLQGNARAVWLIYARENEASAEALIAALAEHGIVVMWDRLLQPGRHYDEQIERGIRNSIAVLGLFSEQAVYSAFMRDEALLAVECEKLIPVLLDGFDARELPMRFRRIQSCRADRIDDLVAAIRARGHGASPLAAE